MKLTEARLRALIVLSGVLLILFGISKAVFQFQLPEPVERWISTGLFCTAALLFVLLFKLRRQERKASSQRKGRWS